jgi:hypothetical protein
MDYKKFLENPNTQKYLKNYLNSDNAVNKKTDQSKQLNEQINEKKSKHKVKNNLDDNLEDTGYSIKDIIDECPKTSEVRDFFKFQIENICDEEDLLFS